MSWRTPTKEQAAAPARPKHDLLALAAMALIATTLSLAVINYPWVSAAVVVVLSGVASLFSPVTRQSQKRDAYGRFCK